MVDIFDAVETTQELVKGAYATITMIAGHGLLAFTDPLGIRPLVLGRRDTPDGPGVRLRVGKHLLRLPGL